jgi:hypothetical protein
MDALKRLREFQPLKYAERMTLAKALDDKTTPDLACLRAGDAPKGPASFDVDKGTGIFRISGPKTDRYGDTVQPKGMDNEEFRKTPVILFGHNDENPPIGKSMGEEPEDDGVYSLAQFDLKNDPDGFNKKVFGQYVDGFMTAVSIRFVPKAYDKIMKTVTVDDVEKEVWTGGFDFKEWELLEYSAVPIPAYPDALALSAGAVLGMAKRLGVLPKLKATPTRLDDLVEEVERLSAELERLKEGPELALQIKGLEGLDPEQARAVAAFLADRLPGAEALPPTATGAGEKGAAANVARLAALEKAMQGVRVLTDEVRAR